LVQEAADVADGGDRLSAAASLDLLTLVDGHPLISAATAASPASVDRDSTEHPDLEELVENEEILTEVSTTSHGVFKVHYLDHSKAYIPRVSANEKYRR